MPPRRLRRPTFQASTFKVMDLSRPHPYRPPTAERHKPTLAVMERGEVLDTTFTVAGTDLIARVGGTTDAEIVLERAIQEAKGRQWKVELLPSTEEMHARSGAASAPGVLWEGNDVMMPTVVIAASNAAFPTKADYQCPGTADQSGINTYGVGALPASGGTVVLTEGLFSQTGAIVLVANANLVGQGPATTLQLAAASATLSQITATNRNYVRIADVTVNGKRVDNPGPAGAWGDWAAILLQNCDVVVLERVTFQNTRCIPLLLRDCQYLWLIDCRWENCAGQNVYVATSTQSITQVKIVRPEIRGASDTPINVVGSSTFTVDDLYIDAPTIVYTADFVNLSANVSAGATTLAVATASDGVFFAGQQLVLKDDVTTTGETVTVSYISRSGGTTTITLTGAVVGNYTTAQTARVRPNHNGIHLTGCLVGTVDVPHIHSNNTKTGIIYADSDCGHITVNAGELREALRDPTAAELAHLAADHPGQTISGQIPASDGYQAGIGTAVGVSRLTVNGTYIEGVTADAISSRATITEIDVPYAYRTGWKGLDSAFTLEPQCEVGHIRGATAHYCYGRGARQSLSCPKATLSATANAAQTVVYITAVDNTIIQAGDEVFLFDGSGEEYNTINSLTGPTGGVYRLVMTNNLANTYTAGGGSPAKMLWLERRQRDYEISDCHMIQNYLSGIRISHGDCRLTDNECVDNGHHKAELLLPTMEIAATHQFLLTVAANVGDRVIAGNPASFGLDEEVTIVDGASTEVNSLLGMSDYRARVWIRKALANNYGIGATVTKSDYHGITTDGDNNILEGNRCKNQDTTSQQRGISQPSGDYNTVTGNNTRGNTASPTTLVSGANTINQHNQV